MDWTLTVCMFQTLSGYHHVTNAANCSPFHLDGQLSDAASQEHMTSFVINTFGFYKFLHPCASNVEAALKLFYDEHSAVPDSSSGLWGQMSQAIKDTALVGRRRRRLAVSHVRHFVSDEDLLNNDLQLLLHETGNKGECVQYLIERYRDVAASAFRKLHPHFHALTLPPTTTTTTTVSPPTSAPTTTTPRLTTTTTPESTTPTSTTPTTTTPLPVTSTPMPTTTTTMPTTTPPSTPTSVTYGPISCTQCSGLMCLLGSHVTACPDGQFFCETTIEETDTGRQISRGCANQGMCDSFHLMQDQALCGQVDSQLLPSGNTCHFCCVGDNCNAPPHVKPAASSLYPQP